MVIFTKVFAANGRKLAEYWCWYISHFRWFQSVFMMRLHLTLAPYICSI